MFLPAVEILISKYTLNFPVNHDTFEFDQRTQIVTFILETEDSVERTQISLEEMKQRMQAAKLDVA